MIIKESDMNIGAGYNALALLDEMAYLTEEESAYYPAMVPVLENSRIGAYTIALEDIDEFCESNGIADMGYAVSQICEAAKIQPSDVVFTIKEENIIGNDELAGLAADIMNEGIGIAALPISDNDPHMILADVALEACQYGDDSLLEAYINRDWDMLLEKAQGGGAEWIEARQKAEAEADDDSAATTIAEKPNRAPKTGAAAMLEKVKHAASWPIRQISKMIAALRRWAFKNRNAEGAIKSRIAKAIDWLTSLLHKKKIEPGTAGNNPNAKGGVATYDQNTGTSTYKDN